MQKRKLRPYQYLRVTASELVPEGLALCHPSDEGFHEKFFPLTGFVLGLLPGEEGIIRITQSKKKFFHGVLANKEEFNNALKEETKRENILIENMEDWIDHPNSFITDNEKWLLWNPSPDRIPDQCDHFILCGGCRMMHLPYEKTLKFKKQWAITHFNREKIENKKFIDSMELIPSKKIFEYRNHVQVHINKYKERGFYAPYSYRTKKFPSHGCHLFDQKAFDESFPENLELERVIRSRIDYIDHHINYHSLNSLEDKSAKFTYTIEYPENSKTKITFSNPSFFQVNTSILPQWLQYIEKVLDIPKNSEEPIRILEIFSGFGFISRLLSFKHKIIALGIDYAKEEEIQTVQIDNNLYTEFDKHFFREHYMRHDISQLDKLHPARLKRLRDFKADHIIINPPRSGFYTDSLHFFLKNIIDQKNQQMIYSSCNASTLARDLKILEEYGYYSHEIKLFDFFPFTSHFEMVAVIRKKKDI